MTFARPSKIVQHFKFNTRTRSRGRVDCSLQCSTERGSRTLRVCSNSIRDRILCGVHHEGIQKRLLAEKELTYKKAYELSLSMESAERDTSLRIPSAQLQELIEVHFTRTHRHSPAKAPQKRQKETGKRGPIVHLAPDCPFKGSIIALLLSVWLM